MFKVAFYKEKQVRRGGDMGKFVEAMKINPAEGTSYFLRYHTSLMMKNRNFHLYDSCSVVESVKLIHRRSLEHAHPNLSHHR